MHAIEKIDEAFKQRFLQGEILKVAGDNDVVGFPELSMMLGVEGL